MVVEYVSKVFLKLFGSRNERVVKTYHRRVEPVNEHEEAVRKLSDGELRAKTQAFKQRIDDGESIALITPEALAVAREAMDRSIGLRNIFNPAHKFDPNTLPANVRPLYDKVKQEIDQLEPEQVLGCEQHPELHHEWDPVPAWMRPEIPVELYEAVRELYPQSRPPFRCRPFDVQLIGGLVLSEGRIAEMKTGEGKTIVAPLACYLACLEGLRCHVVTTNDYLVQRDRDWVFPFYYWLGLTVGAIHPFHMQPHPLKAKAYGCNVLYGTNSELGFDYLRDNMKLTTEEQVQKHRDFVIVDEVDSILIDEARTPLIISGPAHDDAPRYGLADQVARKLMEKQRAWDAADQKVQQCQMRISALEGDVRNARDKETSQKYREEMEQLQEEELPRLEDERARHIQYYEIERDKKAAHLTHEGVAEAQRVANIGSFYAGSNIDMPHLLENALRAHVVYQRDKEYVVQGGEVVIVDEFTGRLMVGRQWSDGLHQAVEAKERVKIKEETQTLATVTIQNFFKLYKRLAGMTGTAMTEANEFNEIYKLDVVAIPTNVPVIRRDRDDLIFMSHKDKWGAILDEIKRMHDIGRPVLVGTTSVESSEMLSQMLSKRHTIKHDVLNAKQHEREAQVVEHAGEIGAVMIATNMAGRGTDIKLRPIDRQALVTHWQRRNLLPSEAKPEMTDDALIELSYRHQATYVLGMKRNEAKSMDFDELKLQLLRHWVAEDPYMDEDKAASMGEQACLDQLDRVAEFRLHRLTIWDNIEAMGGLHIVGTERHESRRIDNQLRGRAGRQGDQGSSRFFISLEDDLMKMFAGKLTLNALSKLGMKEGASLEHRWITKSVERAQRKVEERNFQIRKNLLEYDEVMEHQRNGFYGVRQAVLEGRDIDNIIFDYITEAVGDACDTYLDPDYVPNQMAEWCRSEARVSIDPVRLRNEDNLHSLVETIRDEARTEVQQTVETQLGEYMGDDTDPEQWDLRGLSSWAASQFGISLSQNRLRRMSIDEVRDRLIEAAQESVDDRDFSGIGRYLEPLYAQKQLAEWVNGKFGLEFQPEELEREDASEVQRLILDRAQEQYRRREIVYPVEFILDLAFNAAQQDTEWAVNELTNWVNQRYDLDWKPEDVREKSGGELHKELVEINEQWMNNGKLDELVDGKLRETTDTEALAEWSRQRFDVPLDAEDLRGMDRERLHEELVTAGRKMLRGELTQLERFVLLQILDGAWKDHLYAMDQLRDSVSLQSYAEKDPRIEYKRQGANHFAQMQSTVRDRVTDLIFRARLSANVELRNVYGEQKAEHEEGQGAMAAARAAAAQGTDEQRADMAAAESAAGAGGREQQYASRKQRRAAAAADRHGRKRPNVKQRKRRR